jgi:FkbM family methyltransferase
VGANIGNRVQPLLNIGARIVAVEPQKKCHELLKFRFGRSIEIVTQGLGEREEVRDFYEASEHIISSFSTEWIEAVRKTRFQKYSWSEPVKIQMTTLDKLVSIHGIPKFIKIDVEGFELEVLKGLTHAVRLISFEYTVPEQTSKAIACIEQIETHSPGAVCNYSIGESMEFAMKEWMPASDFRAFLLTDVFSETSFGDIYVRSS